ncbi:DUF2125 domain-containing protein [Pseudooceanicola onchidii]|uniref:DUF2125 domain-containing protein n=1 Tax=Pseudooceanicola onchidii TaxID=2562279 RepID=UPI00145BDEB2|nr:DUF2125 domain-containing protein [Pseudooceanicola onchidii]
MKRLFFVVIAAALLWSGYWVYGAQSVRSGVEDWFDLRRDEGWVADYDDFAVRGFPNRFDATWQGLTLADPDTGVAWTMPQFQLLALSYRPRHMIAAWPQRMQLATPTDKLEITSDRLRASLRIGSGPTGELERAVLEGQTIAFTGAESGTLAELHLAAERTAETTYRLGLEARDLSPPAPMLRRTFGDQALPDTVQLARLDATATFDRPWDVTALEVSRPQPTRIDIATLRAEWGVMAFQARGTLDIDTATGRASGTLALQAEEWQQMLEIAQASGAITDTMAQAARGVLQMAANASGNPASIDVEVTLKDGIAYLGFLPIGPFPRIFLR